MGTLQYIALGVYSLTVFVTIVVVILENRSPIRTLAWVLVLVFAPLIGIVLFYFFGQNNRQIRNISKQYPLWSKILPDEFSINECLAELPDRYTSLSTLLTRTCVSFVIKGSEVEVITTGKRKFDALLDDIAQARHHIHMEYFIFNDDDTGRRVKEALMAKAEQGVEVRFLYDNVANIKIPSRFYNEMEASGVLVSPFMKIRLPNFKSRVNYRNHRKVVVIDGSIGYIGGMNVGDEYNKDPNWRDTHLRICGRGVYGLQSNFLMDWYSSGEKRVGDEAHYFPSCEVHSNNLLQIAAGGPNMQWPNLMQATLQIIVSAKKYLYIQTPYFLPTESLFEALQTAALAGVDVRLMVSHKSDSIYVDPAAKSYYSELLRAGLRIFEHQTKFIHAKTMVADDYLSVIGSANMDFRSFESNFEINGYLYDASLAAQNKAIFMEDLKGCKEVLLEEWSNRPWWKKSLESILRLFAPLL